MEKKFSLILDKDFVDYCTLNKIEDIEKYAKDVFNRGFNLVKYGNSPFGSFTATPTSTPLPKEKITEVIEKTNEKIKNNNLYDE
jgi:hypothetical protein